MIKSMQLQWIYQEVVKMQIKPIKTEQDYQAALSQLETLWDAQEGTDEFDQLDVLATLIEAYERKHHQIEAPDPVQAILFRMEQEGLTPSDMTKYLGNKSKVSEVLNYKRALSITMIRKLATGLDIDPAILINNYQLNTSVRL